MTINDLFYRIEKFKREIQHPVPAYFRRNDPEYNGDMFYQELGDEHIDGVADRPEELDFWSEEELFGFRLVNESYKGAMIPIFELYIEGGCPYYMERFRWPGTVDEYKTFLERMKNEVFTVDMRMVHLLYGMFNKD